MQLPDESIVYEYQSLLAPQMEEWTPAAELRSRHFLSPDKLRDLLPQLQTVRSQIAAERELTDIPPELQPLEAGFIDLPQQLLDAHRRKGEASELGRILTVASRLKAETDRIVILGVGGSYLGPRVLFDSLCNTYHNELSSDARMGVPRIYFSGNNFDNDALQDLLDLLQTTCVDPEAGREERWGVIVISKSGETLETATTYRAFRREAAEYYGSSSELLRQVIVPITSQTGKLRELSRADGYTDEDIFTIPDNVGGRFSVLTAVGLLPAAVMGLDIRALLLGAAAMTRRFLEEPYERNPVLQFAAVNYLMSEQYGKPIRVMAVWSKKLESLGMWYDQLLAESLGKQGRGATPLTVVCTRDLHARGQQFQEGQRDKIINNVVVKTQKTPAITIGMADHNEDDLNSLSRKGMPDLLDAAWRGMNLAYFDAARPTANLILPSLSEHVMGQLFQMLMLATVVEGRLMGINPYGQPGVEAYKRNMRAFLRSTNSSSQSPM
ncbi:MAG: glucose-6-phosphate isomerase [Gemmatales bacterium]|nr:MAG: glucose-6-phosphate isomerase [Gemmatales bacterium]